MRRLADIVTLHLSSRWGDVTSDIPSLLLLHSPNLLPSHVDLLPGPSITVLGPDALIAAFWTGRRYARCMYELQRWSAACVCLAHIIMRYRRTHRQTYNNENGWQDFLPCFLLGNYKIALASLIRNTWGHLELETCAHV